MTASHPHKVCGKRSWRWFTAINGARRITGPVLSYRVSTTIESKWTDRSVLFLRSQP